MNRHQQEIQALMKPFGFFADEELPDELPDEQPTLDELFGGEYEALNAKDVLAKLIDSDLSPASIALIRDHESANKNRKTVLEALEEIV